MNIWRIEIRKKDGIFDPQGDGVLHELRDFGIETIERVEFRKIFLLLSDVKEDEVRQITNKLLLDPVIEEVSIELNAPAWENNDHQVTSMEVHFLPGVMDTVAESTKEAISKLGFKVDDVHTAKRYIFYGQLTEADKKLIASRIIANECIEQVYFGSAGSVKPAEPQDYVFKLRTIPIRNLSDSELLKLSKESDLFLNLEEMRTIQDYYRKIGRDPSDVEIETLAQTWSEHCVHKTLKSDIDYEGPEGKIEFKNLLKSTIIRATEELNKPWCISVFSDNSGIIEFDEEFGVCFKVETHNHPSAIEPYGGASTGIGGVIRDPLGTGLGAKPIANTDVFCFAFPETKLEDLPKGALHPRRVFKGVVAGVRDYGNRMGIPTVNGAIWFDERYIGNPLVYCGNIGLIPKDKCFGSPKVGDYVVVVGGRTGRDGIHGATFSSGELTDRSETEFSHAVQIGNPITEKKMVDVILQARDYPEGCLYNAITDCGAGGLSSAVGEMGAELGAEVDLEKVPLKYKGLRYDEIWISEAQERMVLAVPPENWEKFKEIFDNEDVEATVIGKFCDHQRLILRYEGNQVCDLDMDFLHKGLPKSKKSAYWAPKKFDEPSLGERKSLDYTKILRQLLSHPNIASKEWVIRQYDHEVQGGSAIKPLTGRFNNGPSDCAVIRPRLDSNRGLAIGCGINPDYGQIDPFWMSACCIDEAIRNVVSVGGNPNHCAILDNFCWDSCNTPEKLGTLVRSAQGCYESAVKLGVPFISGKDSLNNEFVTESGERISIPPTLLISAIAIVEDVNKCVSMDFKQPDSRVYLVGRTQNHLGGSHYYKLLGYIGNSVPQVDFTSACRVYSFIHKLIMDRIILSCHDLSEGGLAVALAEMSFAGNLGLYINLDELAEKMSISEPDVLLFSETPTRFLVEVSANFENIFLQLAKEYSVPVVCLGTTIANDTFTVLLRENILLEDTVENLRKCWLGGIQI